MSRILVVDDEAHIRLLIEQALEELEDQGVEIMTADNGADALETIKKEKPQLVFLDVMMPKMNGFDVCQAVKQEFKMQNIYIVLFTAEGQKEDKNHQDKITIEKQETKHHD